VPKRVTTWGKNSVQTYYDFVRKRFVGQNVTYILRYLSSIVETGHCTAGTCTYSTYLIYEHTLVFILIFGISLTYVGSRYTKHRGSINDNN